MKFILIFTTHGRRSLPSGQIGPALGGDAAKEMARLCKRRWMTIAAPGAGWGCSGCKPSYAG